MYALELSGRRTHAHLDGGRVTFTTWKREAALWLIASVFLLWPVFVNSGPFYESDSASYIRGGKLGVETGVAMLDRWAAQAPSRQAAPAPQDDVDRAIANSGGARSAIYSVAAYLLRWPGNTLLCLVVLQALATAFVICSLRRLLAPQAEFWTAIAASAALGVLSSAAWYSAYAMPDILAGIGICAALLLTVFFPRITTGMKVALALLIAFSITAHGSHLPIIALTLAAGTIASWCLPYVRSSSRLRSIVWFASPILLAVTATVATSYAAFGEISLWPKRYPIQLARSVADGPGASYLHDHCATEHYAVCEVLGPNPPRDVLQFLWGPNGLRYRATPAQMERIRAEEPTIVRRAALAYPMFQIRRSVTNAFEQLIDFGPELLFGARMLGSGQEMTPVPVASDRPALKLVAKILIYAGFIGSILFLVAARRQLTRSEKSALAVVTVGLVANAAVCGMLSAVAARYQGRVAWVLPALAVMILLRMASDRDTKVTTT